MGSTSAGPRETLTPFVFTAAALALTLGVSTGGWAMWQMAFAAGTVLPSHLQLHAHVQLVGFALLFLLGLTFHALPGILGVPPAPRRLVVTVLAGVGGGALFRAIGQPLAPWAAGRFLSLLSGALELAGIFAFAAWALPVLAGRRENGDPFTLHLLLGTSWAAVAAALSAAQALFLAGHAESTVPGDLVEPFYAVVLYGALLSWLFAFSSRVVPASLGLPRPSAQSARRVATVQGAGALLLAAAWIPGFFPPPTARFLTLAGTLLLAAAILGFLVASRILAPRAGSAAPPFLRAPFLFLALFAAISLAAAAAELGGATVHKFVWDGARHVYTIGFVTLLVVAMSLHVVPFAARALGRPREARLALGLVAAAAGVRALQIPVALGWGGLPLYRLVGATGIVATAGLLLWVHVLAARPRDEGWARRTGGSPTPAQ